MTKWRSICVGCIGLAVVLGGWTAFAGDWTQWGGGDCRNLVLDEKGLPDSFVPGDKKTAAGIDLASTKNVKWVARLGNYAYGNPTIANGRVFVGTDCQTLSPEARKATDGCGMVKCLDEATGKVLWQLVTPKRTSWSPPRISTPRPGHLLFADGGRRPRLRGQQRRRGSLPGRPRPAESDAGASRRRQGDLALRSHR